MLSRYHYRWYLIALYFSKPLFIFIGIRLFFLILYFFISDHAIYLLSKNNQDAILSPDCRLLIDKLTLTHKTLILKVSNFKNELLLPPHLIIHAVFPIIGLPD